MGFSECPGQGITMSGHSNEMNMVGHQASRQNLEFITATFFSDKVEVGFPICIRSENIYGAHTALGNVVRVIGDDDSGYSPHAEIIYKVMGKIK